MSDTTIFTLPLASKMFAQPSPSRAGSIVMKSAVRPAVSVDYASCKSISRVDWWVGVSLLAVIILSLEAIAVLWIYPLTRMYAESSGLPQLEAIEIGLQAMWVSVSAFLIFNVLATLPFLTQGKSKR